MRPLNSIVALGLAIGVLSLSTGCSVFMAAKQPGKKDLNKLAVGTPRPLVIAEFGAPITTEIKDGAKIDIFSFVQGYSKGARTSRALFHGTADVFTLGLWEVVGTPTEAVFDGQETVVQVNYDASEKVASSQVLKQK